MHYEKDVHIIGGYCKAHILLYVYALLCLFYDAFPKTCGMLAHLLTFQFMLRRGIRTDLLGFFMEVLKDAKHF